MPYTNTNFQASHPELLELFKRGRLKEASKLATELRQTDAENVDLLELSGNIYLAQKLYEEAVETYQTAIDLDRTKATLFLNYGVALERLERLTDAHAAVDSCLLLDNSLADAHFNKGILYHHESKFLQAVAAFDRAIQLDSTHSEAFHQKGISLHSMGDHLGAKHAFEEALKIKPGHVPCLVNSSALLAYQGKHTEAFAQLKLALEIDPSNVAAIEKLGNLLVTTKDYESASKCFLALTRLEPGNAVHWINLSKVAQSQGDPLQAIETLQSAAKLFPHDPEIISSLGVALYEGGNHAESATVLQAALGLRPTPSILNNLGNVFRVLGRENEAAKAYESVAEDSIELYPIATRHLSLLTGYKFDEQSVAEAKKRWACGDDNDPGKCQIGFALFNIMRKKEHYSEAYQYLQCANALRKAQLDYVISDDIKTFRFVKTKALEWANSVEKTTALESGVTPIFIVGMPRSGTTLVEQIVSCHSTVVAGGELKFATRHILQLINDPGSVTNKTSVLHDRYMSDALTSTHAEKFFTDKLPHNFLFTPILAKAFPSAKIIHVYRDPAATCWSNFATYFPSKALGYSNDLDDLVKYYKLYQQLMQCYAQLIGGNMYHLDYEQLCSKPDTEIRSLYEFLELPWEASALSPHLNPRPIKTASASQVRRPIYAKSSEAWKNFAPFTDDQLSDIQKFDPASTS